MNAQTFLRATGLLLAPLVAVHLLSVARFAAAVPPDTFLAPAWEAASSRLSNPFWRFWDWTAFTVALAHGGVGLHLLVADRVRAPRWRSAAEAALLVSLVLVAGLATYAYLTVPFGARNPVLGGS